MTQAVLARLHLLHVSMHALGSLEWPGCSIVLSGLQALPRKTKSPAKNHDGQRDELCGWNK